MRMHAPAGHILLQYRTPIQIKIFTYSYPVYMYTFMYVYQVCTYWYSTLTRVISCILHIAGIGILAL